jgi:hypothetical protein
MSFRPQLHFRTAVPLLVGAAIASFVSHAVLAQPAPTAQALDGGAPADASSADPDAATVSVGAVTLAPPSLVDGGSTAADASSSGDAGAGDAGDTGDGGAKGGVRTVRIGQSVEDFMERDFTWDANIEGGLGVGLRDGPAQFLGMARIRLGAMLVSAPNFFMLGATYEWQNKSFATFGLQFEYIHLISGLWFQIAPLLDVQHVRPGVSASVGWSLFGAEIQQRAYEGLGPTTALFGKIRVPVGFLVWALTYRRHAQDAYAPARRVPLSGIIF